jgi:hypothetical protein
VGALVKPHESAVAASRYETFVIRLWIEPEAVVEHGEIRHIKSNHTVHFRDFDRAMKFMLDAIHGEDAAHGDPLV